MFTHIRGNQEKEHTELQEHREEGVDPIRPRYISPGRLLTVLLSSVKRRFLLNIY